LYNGKSYPVVTSDIVEAILKPQVIDKYIKNEDLRRLLPLLPHDIGSAVICWIKLGYTDTETIY
jgi:hypothetical protein